MNYPKIESDLVSGVENLERAYRLIEKNIDFRDYDVKAIYFLDAFAKLSKDRTIHTQINQVIDDHGVDLELQLYGSYTSRLVTKLDYFYRNYDEDHSVDYNLEVRHPLIGIPTSLHLVYDDYRTGLYFHEGNHPKLDEIKEVFGKLLFNIKK